MYPGNPHYLMNAHGEPFLLIGYGDERLDDPATLDKLKGSVTYVRAYYAVFVRRYGWNAKWQDEPWPVIGGKVDMDAWQDAYWRRLRHRLRAAERRNIVVGLTIWDGHTALPGGKAGADSFWNADRNLQGNQWAYDADALTRYTNPSKHGSPAERLVYYQRRVVDKLLEEIRDFSNVIIELNNEESRGAPEKWWLWWAKYFKDRGYVVAVNEAGCGGVSDGVAASSPYIDMKSYHERTDAVITPARYKFNKVIVADADNSCIDLDPDTARRIAWKSVLRGGGWNDFVCMQQPFPNQTKTRYYRHLLTFVSSQHIPFWEMAPSGRLASSGYALAKRGSCYLVYAEHDVEVDLSGASGTLRYLWYDPRKGCKITSGTVLGGAKRRFSIPEANDCILWIAALRNNRPVSTPSK